MDRLEPRAQLPKVPNLQSINGDVMRYLERWLYSSTRMLRDTFHVHPSGFAELGGWPNKCGTAVLYVPCNN